MMTFLCELCELKLYSCISFFSLPFIFFLYFSSIRLFSLTRKVFLIFFHSIFCRGVLFHKIMISPSEIREKSKGKRLQFAFGIKVSFKFIESSGTNVATGIVWDPYHILNTISIQTININDSKNEYISSLFIMFLFFLIQLMISNGFQLIVTILKYMFWILKMNICHESIVNW